MPLPTALRGSNIIFPDVMIAPVPIAFRRFLFLAGDNRIAFPTVSDLTDKIGFQSVVVGEVAKIGRQMDVGGGFSRLEKSPLGPDDETSAVQ